MTTVHIDVRLPDFLTLVDSYIEFTPTSRIVGEDFVVLPQPYKVFTGDAASDIELEPSTAEWVWKVVERAPGGSRFYVEVPDSPTPVNYGELVVVDPLGYTPLDPLPPTAAEILTDASAARDAAEAAAASVAPGVANGTATLDAAARLPEAQVPTRLSEASLSNTYAAIDGTPREVKPNGDTRSGVLDWSNDSAVGYLLHLRAGPNSAAATAAVGIGTDQGSGGAMVLALKNAGAGLSIGSHPSHTGKAFGLNSYGTDATPVDVSLYSGSDPIVIQHKLGMGFSDGVTTNGSTTFTSATANFTAGDVGQTLTQTTSRGEGFRIPAGTTIASVTNSTTVVLSAAATGSATGINFLVGNRAVPANQEYIGFYNGAAEQTAAIAANKATFRCVLESFGGTSLTAASQYMNGASTKFYTHNGTNYTAHEINADAFAIRLRHYAAAGKGSEASPVQSFIATQSGGAPRLGFFGASSTAKPTVTGSRGGNAALASLLTALATLGLITDSSTA